MLRPSVLTFLLLAASGARSQTAPLAERVLGDWANADSVSYQTFDENGTEMVDEHGESLFAILYLHLSLSDSLYTTTTVYREDGELRASESSWPYEIHNDVLYSGGQPPLHVRVEDDALILSRTDSLGTLETYVYTRTAPLHAPEALLGDWITGTLTDDAGVVFDLPFRFHADGTFLAGYSEPLAYRVVGPYVLLQKDDFTDETGTLTTLFRVAELESARGRITLHTQGEAPLVLYRR